MLQERIIKLETVYHMVTTIESIWGRIEKLEQLVTIQGEQIRRLEANMELLAINIAKIMDFLGIKPAE